MNHQCEALARTYADGKQFTIYPGEVLPPNIEAYTRCLEPADQTRILGITIRHFCSAHYARHLEISNG